MPLRGSADAASSCGWERQLSHFSTTRGSPKIALCSRRASVTSPPSLFLPAFALALPGLPSEHRLLCIYLGLSLLTKLLIPLHRGQSSDPKLFLQSCGSASCLHKAYGVGIAQHGRADGRPGEPCSLAQPPKQEGETIPGERMT